MPSRGVDGSDEGNPPPKRVLDCMSLPVSLKILTIAQQKEEGVMSSFLSVMAIFKIPQGDRNASMTRIKT
jgi:hypothetical protein